LQHKIGLGEVNNLTQYSARRSWATISRNDAKINKYDVHEALNHVDADMKLPTFMLIGIFRIFGMQIERFWICLIGRTSPKIWQRTKLYAKKMTWQNSRNPHHVSNCKKFSLVKIYVKTSQNMQLLKHSVSGCCVPVVCMSAYIGTYINAYITICHHLYHHLPPFITTYISTSKIFRRKMASCVFVYTKTTKLFRSRNF